MYVVKGHAFTGPDTLQHPPPPPPPPPRNGVVRAMFGLK